MDRETAFTLITGSSIIFITIVALILLNSPALSPASASEETICNTYSYSSPLAKNLVFIANAQQTQKYSQALFEFSPLKENRNAFNIYYINEEPQCELYKEKALFCHSKPLIKLADSCPNDYIFVLQEAPSKIRSSSYLNVLSINTNHQLSVMAHEFGHAFANLAEEYTPASLPKGTPNCALSCSEFDGLDDSCSQGCSTSAHFRSIDAGVMRTLNSDTFGTFNEEIIESLIPKEAQSITGNVVSEDFKDCNNEFYHLITASFNSGSIDILDKKIELGCVGGNGGQTFSYKIKDANNTEIGSDKFNPELVFTEDHQEDSETLSGQTFDFQGVFYLKVQNIPESKTLEIYNLDNEFLTGVNISEIKTNRPCKIN